MRLLSHLASHASQHRAERELVSEGRAETPRFILAGWACRQRHLPDGRRQIFDFLVPGDAMGLSGDVARTSVFALTPLLTIDAAALQAAALDAEAHPALAGALVAIPLEDHARLMDHVVRLGSLDAYERVIHLLLELRDRQSPGPERLRRFPLPVTQQILADVLGLSAVHINRVLQRLRQERLLEVRSGWATLLNPERLAAACQYEATRF